MPTSGTVSTTVFRTRKVIDHAYRRCRIIPQAITAERIQTALDLLYLLLSQMANRGVSLWTIEKQILPMYYGRQSVPAPIGTVDVLNCNLRNLQRLEGTPSASEGDAELAFDGDIDTACTQTLAAGYIQLQLASGTQATNFGILPNASGTWEFSLQGSNDGSTWTTFYSNAEYEAVDGEWLWFDLEGVQNWTYYRLVAGATTILDVREWVLGNMPNEIPLAQVNLDDYANLPNKTFLGRPTEYWYDKQRTQPILTIWPTPGDEYTFWQLVLYVKRYVQDVGSLTQELEVPQSWYLAIIEKLAAEIALEDREVDPALVPTLQLRGDNAWRDAWDGQSDGSAVKLAVNISPYTR